MVMGVGAVFNYGKAVAAGGLSSSHAGAGYAAAPRLRHSGFLFPDGVLSGLCGIGLALLGILSFGPMFLILAAAASVVSLVRSMVRLSGTGFLTAVLSSGLTALGFFLCLTVWKTLFTICGVSAYLR